MNTVNINGVELPVVEVDKYLFSRSTQRCKYRFINDELGDVLEIESDYCYRIEKYYDLYDIKGNFIKKDFVFHNEKTREFLSVKSQDSYKKMVLYLNGDFRFLSVENNAINTMDEVSLFHNVLSCKYKCYYDPKNDYKLRRKYDNMPFYYIIGGHSRCIQGLLSRNDISMSYKELKEKIKRAKEKYSDHIAYDFNEDLKNMERYLVDAISKYLMITPKQYKAGRFSLVNCLIKRINYNINNKNK